MIEDPQIVPQASRRREWLTFLILTLIILPALAVIFVGGFGFVVWMEQLVNGPPRVKF